MTQEETGKTQWTHNQLINFFNCQIFILTMIVGTDDFNGKFYQAHKSYVTKSNTEHGSHMRLAYPQHPDEKKFISGNYCLIFFRIINVKLTHKKAANGLYRHTSQMLQV